MKERVMGILLSASLLVGMLGAAPVYAEEGGSDTLNVGLYSDIISLDSAFAYDN